MDKICVITGGAAGIGKTLVESFAQNNYQVIFIDHNAENLNKTKEEMLSKGYLIDGYVGDIGEESVLTSFAEYVIQKYGKIHILINNACISKKGILSDCSYDDFNYVLKIGVTAPYQLSKLFKDYFQEGSSIINISSTRALISQRDTESYSAAKGGIAALTHALAVSFAGKVRVNAISPGWIDTRITYGLEVSEFSENDKKQHPSGRVGVPDDIARVALFLCDEKNSFINGENITVDGGMTKQMIYHDDNGWAFHSDI